MFHTVVFLNHIYKKELYPKNMLILIFIFISVVTFLLFFISLYGLKLLSSVLSFQPEVFSFVSLIEQAYKKQIVSLFLSASILIFLLVCRISLLDIECWEIGSYLI